MIQGQHLGKDVSGNVDIDAMEEYCIIDLPGGEVPPPEWQFYTLDYRHRGRWKYHTGEKTSFRY